MPKLIKAAAVETVIFNANVAEGETALREQHVAVDPAEIKDLRCEAVTGEAAVAGAVDVVLELKDGTVHRRQFQPRPVLEEAERWRRLWESQLPKPQREKGRRE